MPRSPMLRNAWPDTECMTGAGPGALSLFRPVLGGLLAIAAAPRRSTP